MDAAKFSENNLAEIKQRLSHREVYKTKNDDNFGKTKEEVIQKFLDDQKIDFDNIDITSIITLAEK